MESLLMCFLVDNEMCKGRGTQTPESLHSLITDNGGGHYSHGDVNKGEDQGGDLQYRINNAEA